MVNIKNSRFLNANCYDKKCIYYYINRHYCSIVFHVDLLSHRRKLKKYMRKILNDYGEVVIRVVNDNILNEFIELCNKDEYYKNISIANYFQYKNIFNLNYYKHLFITDHEKLDIFMSSLKNIKANANNIFK